jgi:hypothetical protein
MDIKAPPTPEQIGQLLASGDKEQVKQAQRLLQGLGYYRGTIDGVLQNKKGESATLDAVKSYRDDFKDQSNQSLRGRELDAEASERSWQNQALQAAPWLALPVGLAYGYSKGKKIEARQLATEAAQRAGVLPDAPRSWSPTRRFAGRFAPYAGQAGIFAAEGLALREMVAPQIPNKTAKQLTQAAGTGLVAAGVGTAAAGWGNAFTPQVAPPAGPRLPPGGPQNALAVAGQTPPPGTPPAASPAPGSPPAGPRPNSDRLIAAARAAGAKGKLTKTSAAAFLVNNVTDANRAAVAKELGVGPGQKISSAVKRLASKAGRSTILLPLAAGAYAAGEAGNEARAEGATPGETAGRSAVAGGAAAGAAAGGMYGLNKLAEVGARYAPTVARVAGRAAGPVGAGLAAYDVVQGVNRLAHLSPPQDPREYSTMGAFMPDGGNAMQQAGEQPDPFGAALDEFLGLMQELQVAP